MQSIACPLQLASQRKSDQIFIQTDENAYTYHQFYTAVCSASNHLTQQGLKRGGTVGIYTNNPVDCLIIFYSCLRLGMLSCIVNTHLPEQNITKILLDIQADFLLTDTNTFQIDQIQTIAIRDVDCLANQETFEFDTTQPQEVIDFITPATIVYSSGSTNEPKAVVHSLKNHYKSALASNQHLNFTEKDCWLLTLPIYHVSGLSVFFRALSAGASILISTNPQQQSIKPTHTSFVSTQLQKWMNKPSSLSFLRNFKCILLGGGPINPDLITLAINHKLAIYTSYGLTEMSSQVATTDQIHSIEDCTKAKLLDCSHIKITEENEILVKGENLFLGYLNNGQIHLPIDQEGWFHTGDLGSFKNDTLQVHGRKDHLIISGGENIQPEEIEFILKDLAIANEAIVIGINDPTYGQRPIAFIEFGEKQRAFSICQKLSQKLPKYKIPDAFYLLPDSFKLPLGKINRNQFKEYFLNSADHFSKIV